MIQDSLTALVSGIPYTVALTVLSFIIGALVAVPITLLRLAPTKIARLVARLVVDLLRSIPPITWLFLIYFGFPEFGLTLDAFTSALIGLSAISGAYLSETYRAGLLAIPKGQWDACKALGMRPLDIGIYVIAPQALRVVIPPAGTYGIGLLKDTAVASTIGVSEVAFNALQEAQRTGHAIEVLTLGGIVYLLLSLPLAYLSRNMDSRIRARFSMA
jgi:polar amino acid transport system permease protein